MLNQRFPATRQRPSQGAFRLLAPSRVISANEQQRERVRKVLRTVNTSQLDVDEVASERLVERKAALRVSMATIHCWTHG